MFSRPFLKSVLRCHVFNGLLSGQNKPLPTLSFSPACVPPRPHHSLESRDWRVCCHLPHFPAESTCAQVDGAGPVHPITEFHRQMDICIPTGHWMDFVLRVTLDDWKCTLHTFTVIFKFYMKIPKNPQTVMLYVSQCGIW